MQSIVLAMGLVVGVTASARASEPTGGEDDAASRVDVRAASEVAAEQRRAQIARALAEVRDEESSTTRLWPILTIAVATSAVLVAAAGGAIEAIGCDGSCRAGAWQGPTVVGGAALATFGIVWLRWTDADLRDLESRRHRLEGELRELDGSAPTREHAGGAPHLTLAVRASL